MIAGLYLAVYLACGVMIVRFLLPRLPVLSRVWVGLSLGILMMMWLPALLAFGVSFGWTAHLLALLPLGGLTAGAYALRDKRAARGWDAEETALAKQMLLVVLPLTVLSGYLQYTHNMRVDQWGNWNVGQSTYGDLPMHLSFITSLKNGAFPPEYSFYPGHRLSYPFLTDSFSTSFYLMGWPLQLSVIVPGTLMMALCYMGVMCMAREMTTGKKTVILAALLFFLNGGLGFLYDFDQAAGWEADGTPTFWARIQAILNGYYKTPTNQPDPNNLRWSNVIADLMIPQRTILGGWCMSLPCFYLLYLCFDPEKRDAWRGRMTVLLGVWGGLLPLVHTHSFVALALCSAGMLVYDMIHEKERLKQFRQYVIYGAIAALFALPQLFAFTFTQAFQQAGSEGSGNTFMRLWFNWVNNPGGDGNLRDFYFWFYIKNIGLPFIALVLALFERDRKNRRLFSGALVIILAVELVRFQPNVYDNNKLMYLAWLLCCMIVANWCKAMWERLKGLRARPVIAVLLAVATFLSAGLTLWRECVSDYQAFSYRAVEAGEYIRDNTEEHSVFLTGRHHLNPVIAIAGRTIVCGPDLWLYWHGFNTSERERDIAAFYADPAGQTEILTKYGVDYIYVSSYERSSYTVNTDALDSLYEVVFQNGEATIWKVPEG
ncbi:MAG: hypothetical protein J1E43_07315 [Christensenellaceae bacterium]|nr:hypothetical protein [Christensenellaceae bacterium]